MVPNEELLLEGTWPKARLMPTLSGKVGLVRVGPGPRATSRGREAPREALGPVRGVGLEEELVAWLRRDGSPTIWLTRGDWRTRRVVGLVETRGPPVAEPEAGLPVLEGAGREEGLSLADRWGNWTGKSSLLEGPPLEGVPALADSKGRWTGKRGLVLPELELGVAPLRSGAEGFDDGPGFALD
jgi:hypothetical protein